MPVSEEWPHVETYRDDESDEHVLLKNLAVRWLLERGFPPESIECERYTKIAGKSGRTDIYASHQNVEIFIECEVGQCTLSRGGSVPFEDGRCVYMFRRCNHDTNGIFLLESEVRSFKPSSLSPTQEVLEREVVGYRRIGDLPDQPI